MAEEHYIITIQSIWRGEPESAITVSGLLDSKGLTEQELYEWVRHKAIERWSARHPHRPMGEVAVLFYRHELSSKQ